MHFNLDQGPIALAFLAATAADIETEIVPPRNPGFGPMGSRANKSRISLNIPV